MSSEPTPTPGERLRLHPSSVLFELGGQIRGLLLPALVLVLFSRGTGYELWGVVLFVPTAAAAVIRCLRFRYRLDADGLVIWKGVLFRSQRHVPYARIQNIDLVRNPLHRALGVARVQLETAGGAEPEARLQVLSMAAVEELRAQVFAGRAQSAHTTVGADPAAAPEPAPEGELVVQLPTRELIWLGLIANRGLVGLATASYLFWNFVEFNPPDERDLESLRERAQSALRWIDTPGEITLAVVASLAALTLGSIGWAIVTYHGFELRRSGDDLRTRCGVLTRISATVRRDRIQRVVVRQTPLHRLARRCAVRVDTAGGGQAGLPEASRRWLIPLLPRQELSTVLREVVPGLDLDAVSWSPADPRAHRRLFRRASLRAIVVVAMLAPLFPWVATALVVPAGLFCALYARGASRALGHAPVDGFILVRSGWWTRTLAVAPHSKLHVVELRESPFDRRWGMASVGADTAGAGSGSIGVRIPFLERATAVALSTRLGDAVRTTRFRWS